MVRWEDLLEQDAEDHSDHGGLLFPGLMINRFFAGDGCEQDSLNVDRILELVNNGSLDQICQLRSPKGFTVLDCLVCSAPPRAHEGAAAAKYESQMNAIIHLQALGVPCTLTAASMADSVLGDRTGSKTLAAIRAGCGHELCNVQATMSTGIAVPMRWVGQPQQQSFLHEDFIFTACLNDGERVTKQGHEVQNIPELSSGELGLIRRHGATVRFAYPHAARYLREMLRSKIEPPLGVCQQVQVNGRPLTIQQLRYILDNLTELSMDESVRKSIGYVSRYAKFVKQKMRWLKAWHWSEARWADHMQRVLSKQTEIGIHASIIVQFLLGHCTCSICRVGNSIYEDENDDPFDLLCDGDGDSEGNGGGHGQNEEEPEGEGGDEEDENEEEESDGEDGFEEQEDVVNAAIDTNVENHIEHRSPAAEIDPEEAAQVVAQQEAGFLERLVGTSASPVSEVSEANENEAVMLLKLNRIPSFIRRDLATARPLAQCRNALAEAGLPWKTIEGAFVFVPPNLYRQVIAATCNLRPDNIIVSASIEHLVAEVLQGTGIWARSRETIVSATWSAAQSAARTQDPPSTDEKQCCITVKRTFLCITPERHEAVTCSTSDARPHGINPRRF